jgi:hypothetical protein
MHGVSRNETPKVIAGYRKHAVSALIKKGLKKNA